MLVGAGLIATGIVLNPPDIPRSSSSASLWISPSGIAVVGVLP